MARCSARMKLRRCSRKFGDKANKENKANRANMVNKANMCAYNPSISCDSVKALCHLSRFAR